MSKKVILTGLRANNDLHIGNYFGALLPIVDMAQNKSSDYQINLFVPDLHSFTTSIDHSQLQAQIMHNLKIFVAAGLPLDNDNVHIYRQSYISAHSELTWMLDCFTGMGEMSRMTQYKDKSSNSDQSTVGLFNYPVLMAADILLYNATYVPVGDDQTQHLEFTRDIAQRMNSKFGELFTVPLEAKKQHEFFVRDQGLRIMDLADPGRKMSKSDDSGKGVIFLGDDPSLVKKKVMSATTDSLESINYDRANKPGITNIIDIITLIDGVKPEDVASRYTGQTMYGPLKTELAEKLSQFVNDFQAKLKAVDEKALLTKLEKSEKAMNTQAKETLLKVQKALGLR
jgi:tryptophanyl-tRNA synthetase